MPENNDNHEVNGERGLPSVNSSNRGSNALKKIGTVAIGIFALLGILAVNGAFTKKVEKSGPGGVVP